MKKTIYWWISCVVAFIFGFFVNYCVKDFSQFLSLVFLFLTYGICCELDAILKTKT